MKKSYIGLTKIKYEKFANTGLVKHSQKFMSPVNIDKDDKNTVVVDRMTQYRLIKAFI